LRSSHVDTFLTEITNYLPGWENFECYFICTWFREHRGIQAQCV